MESEIWKPVVGYEGNYEVSSIGRVRSIRWRGGYKTHLIFHDLKESGYVEVLLVKNKEMRYRRVHQLVAEAFIPNPDGKPQIDHIDGDRSNNRVENLRWCTQVENMNNPITLRRKAVSQVEPAKEKWRIGCFDMVKKPILQYSLEGELISEWESSAAAARAILGDTKEKGRSAGRITRCCRGEARRAHGYIWVFKGNEDTVNELVERNKMPKEIRVKVNFPDGTSKEYESVNKAAKELGVQNLTFRKTTYSKRLNISWELLDAHTCYENRWGGHRENYNNNRKALELYGKEG